MIKLTIPQTSNDILFETALEPVAAVEDRLCREKGIREGEIKPFLRGENRDALGVRYHENFLYKLKAEKKEISRDIGISEGEIKLFLGGKNRVAVGVPYYENLVTKLKAEKEEISHDIEQMLDRYDFHFVSLSCSFLPDKNCRFTWARFGVELSAISRETGQVLEKRPIAYDMFPDKVLNIMKYKREVNLGSQLKFNFGVAAAKFEGEGKKSADLIEYEPEIIGFGLRRPGVAWDFKKTKQKYIFGNIRDLNLIIRAPKGSAITGKFILGAEVEFYTGKWVSITLTRKMADEIANVEYNLSE